MSLQVARSLSLGLVKVWFVTSSRAHVLSTFLLCRLGDVYFVLWPSPILCARWRLHSRHHIQTRGHPAGGGYCFLLPFKSLEVFLRSLPADFHVNFTNQNLVLGLPLHQSLAMGIWTCKQLLYKIE